MRLPWLRPKAPAPPRWFVRLHLFGPRLELADGNTVEGGYTNRVVRASDVAEARRSAISAAESDLARVTGHPIVDGLFWSVKEAAKAVLEPEEPVGEFHFYTSADDETPPVLLELGRALAAFDLWLYLDEKGVSVQPEDDSQFGVSFCPEGEAFVVATAQWHAHFDDVDQAIACFRWLLTPYYRVVSESQAGERSESWIERWDAEGWTSLDEVLYRNPTDPSLWLGGGWRREYRQQAILRPPEPYDEIVTGVVLDAEGLPPGSVVGLHMETFPRPYAEERGWLHANHDFEAM